MRTFLNAALRSWPELVRDGPQGVQLADRGRFASVVDAEPRVVNKAQLAVNLWGAWRAERRQRDLSALDICARVMSLRCEQGLPLTLFPVLGEALILHCCELLYQSERRCNERLEVCIPHS